MDTDFIERLQQISLTEEEDEVFSVGGDQRKKILDNCYLSLLGRFLTTRPYNQRVAKSLLRSVWKFGTDLRIVDVGDGLFQFKFAMESQLQWVLSNGPWSFEDHPLVLRRWERGMTAATVVFTSIPLWVQVWGLPFDLFTEEVGRDIRKGIGTVVEVDNTAFKSEQARFIGIRVELPLDKPIRRSGFVVSPEGDKVQIRFKYERLAGLCFQCGLFGHEARCPKPKDQGQLKSPYGEWLKAGFRRKEGGTDRSPNSSRRKEQPPCEGYRPKDRPQTNQDTIPGETRAISGFQGGEESEYFPADFRKRKSRKKAQITETSNFDTMDSDYSVGLVTNKDPQKGTNHHTLISAKSTSNPSMKFDLMQSNVAEIGGKEAVETDMVSPLKVPILMRR